MMQNVLHTLNSIWPLSPETEERLTSSVTRVSLPKHTLIVREGVHAGHAYFIEQGITRSFWKIGETEVTTSFAGEGSIVFSMDELYYGNPSEEYVETLENVEAYAITTARLRELFTTNIELCNWARIIHQNEYRRLHRSHKEVLSLPAFDRYEAFKKQFPEICQRVNLGYIASYLGMTLPTLSRIRAASTK